MIATGEAILMTIERQGKVRVCVVGAGRVGMIHATNFRSRVVGAELEAVVDSSIENAERAARDLGVARAFSSLAEALECAEFDAVCIGTPTFAHADDVVLAANSGKHILCEKPLASTMDECRRISRAVEKSGVTFQMGFMRRFDPGFVRAKKIIDEGLIGDPVLVKSLTRGPGLPGKWYFDFDKSNGLLAEVNSHDFDTVRWMMGAEIDKIYAVAGCFKCHDVKKECPEFYDYVTVSIVLDNSALGIIDGACPCDYGYDARVEVVGTKGVVNVGSMRDGSVVVSSKSTGVTSPISSSWKVLFEEAYLAEAKHFIECITTGCQPIAGINDGIQALKAVKAGNESIIAGNPVYLSSVE